MSDYKDIINLPHHQSIKRPHISQYDRAAQFSPFAALTGHDAAVKETARLTDERIMLDENEKAIINEKIQMALYLKENKPIVTVTYFQPDTKKDGGSYTIYSGVIVRIDEYEHRIVFEDKTMLDIDMVYAVDGEIYNL